MVFDDALLRAVLSVCFFLTYTAGAFFKAKFDDDHQAYTIGYWVMAAILVTGLPIVFGIVDAFLN